MKILIILIRGNYYKINCKGEIFGGEHDLTEPSGDWLFLGTSTHHMNNRVIHSFHEIWKNPSLAVKGYMWDKDHGTTRTWSGLYYGQLPRIEACYFE